MDEQTPRYCPRCGGRLSSRKIEGRSRAYCPSCKSPVYRNSKPCAGVLVVDDERVLLVKRTQPPGVGTWSVPAGFLEYDEPPAVGAVRELEEETSITVSEDKVDLFDTAFVTASSRENVVVLIYRVDRSATRGEPDPGSDAGAARFWKVEALENSGEAIEPGYEGLLRRAKTSY